MPEVDAPSTGPKSAPPVAVLRSPSVSFQDGVLSIRAQEVRRLLGTMPPTVMQIGFSDASQSSAQERGLFHAMAGALRDGAGAAVSVRSIPEAVKVVRGGWVVASRDRSSLVTVASPVLFDRLVLESLLGDATPTGWIEPVQGLLVAGGRVRAFTPSI